MTRKKVAIGLSGGVDSSVAAYLLKERGYDVTGVYIEAYNEPGCRTDQDKKDALQVALKLEIPFVTLDVRDEYRKRVVEYFLGAYRTGITPNPDIVCNREVKFGIFYDWAISPSQDRPAFDYVATGHYARIKHADFLTRNPDTLFVARARDITKDQSYFLWHIKQNHLSHILWPLGDTTKQWVRECARSIDLSTATKPDSMGVCMMGELNLRQFLLEKLGTHNGDVVFHDQIIGKHMGLWFHTVGQRGGWEIDKKKLKIMGYEPEKMKPLYVIGKDRNRNLLIVGDKEESYRSEFVVNSLELYNDTSIQQINNWISNRQVFVRIRNLGELYLVSHLHDTTITVDRPVFGVAEGQAAVLYLRDNEQDHEVIIGGGDIDLF